MNEKLENASLMFLYQETIYNIIDSPDYEESNFFIQNGTSPNILIAIANKSKELDDASIEFLEKVMVSIQMDFKKSSIVNLLSHEFNLDKLQNLDFNNLILFHIGSANEIAEYNQEMMYFLGGKKIFSTIDLTQILSNVDGKKKLWNLLKSNFIQ